MDDLIYRQAAIDAIVAWTVEDRPDVEMPTDLIDRIKALPSAQPEIIRCKDCNSADFAGCSGAVCYCMEHGTYMLEWDYCGRAERISNGQVG